MQEHLQSVFSRAASSSSLIIGLFSQCVAINIGASRKMPASVFIIDQHITGRCAHNTFDATGLVGVKVA